MIEDRKVSIKKILLIYVAGLFIPVQDVPETINPGAHVSAAVSSFSSANRTPAGKDSVLIVTHSSYLCRQHVNQVEPFLDLRTLKEPSKNLLSGVPNTRTV